MNEEYKNQILEAVVNEAIDKDKAKGLIIDNPSAFFRYKMERAKIQADEDPAWLLRQRDRLMGPTPHVLGSRACHRCDAELSPVVVFEYNGHDYCDMDCATGETQSMTYSEYKEKVRKAGSVTGRRIEIVDGKPQLGAEFTITYDDILRNEKKNRVHEGFGHDNDF